ncbi:restriction endonuclease subunit S [Riemerella anatipestifer]|uniref:restriction endonuclease subunit S n=1 Tax=Riemerella anatipestifer TaxID=34085 RepID=UPI0012ADD758|nr:restriction endonuclease subunit S [Riemerella anatipestifer]USL95141.1 restriction endonuclease subunit S [Riemerella anatipestifer]
MVYNEILKREIPEEWEMKSLYEIANITMGQSPEGSSYNENKKGIIFFQGSTDFGWRFPLNRVYTTKPTRFAEENDILLSVRAPVGTINLAIERCCIGRGLCAINSKDGFNSFLIYQIEYFKYKFDYLNFIGTTFGSLTKDDLYNLKLSYPAKEILKNFEKIVNNWDKQVKLNTKQIHHLQSLRDTLLPMLMNGQIEIE